MINLADRTVSEASVPGAAPRLCRIYISPNGPVHSREGTLGFLYYKCSDIFCPYFKAYIYCFYHVKPNKLQNVCFLSPLYVPKGQINTVTEKYMCL